MSTVLWPNAPVPLGIRASFPSPGTARLAVAGEVDLATAPILGMRLLAVMKDHHPAVIDVDLAEVTFLDCCGIGVLVVIRKAAAQTGCQVWISHPQPMPAVILDLVGLLGLFTAPVQPSEAAPRGTVTVMPRRTRFVRMARAMVGRNAA